MTDQQYQNKRAKSDPTDIDWEQARRGTRMLLEAVGKDPDSGTLVDTWQRRVPASLEALTEGHRESAKPKMRTFEADASDLVIKTGMPIYSLCKHHLLPYHGTAHLAYRPDGDIVGLSKLSRYVRWQSRDLTIQERLTRDIATGLVEEVNAEAVIVEVTATHLCEAMRGVESATETTTQAREGEVTDSEQRRFRSAVDDHA